MTLYCSPEQDPRPAILGVLAGAQHSLRVSAYALTWPAFADALLAAHTRGVDVQVLVDSSQTLNPPQHALVAHLQAGGVTVLVGTSPKHAILHSKYVVADALNVVHGSFNFTNSAPQQDNVTVVAADAGVAAQLLTHWQHAHDYIAAHPGVIGEAVL